MLVCQHLGTSFGIEGFRRLLVNVTIISITKQSCGMGEFRDFLSGTSGIHLLNFWLDVEEYKDLEESNVENESTLQMLRMKLFRYAFNQMVSLSFLITFDSRRPNIGKQSVSGARILQLASLSKGYTAAYCVQCQKC